jgi:hypothetical protein
MRHYRIRASIVSQKPVFFQRVAYCALLSASCVLHAQEAGSAAEKPAAEKPINQQRVLGVLPNFRTADGTEPYAPITAKQKLTIAAKDSFDGPVYLISGAFAALYQLDNQNPSYGQGLKGYGKRFASSYGDQALGNLMTEGLIPAAFHQDPRYFRLGAGGGSNGHRLSYALTRVIVGKNDKGEWRFNYPEWVGNAAGVAISNVYYPDDTRNARDNAQKLVIQVATDAFSNVLKEFWPDWKAKMFKKKSTAAVPISSGDLAR